jgi:hypothetical protein
MLVTSRSSSAANRRRWIRPALAALSLAMFAAFPAGAQRRGPVVVTGQVVDAGTGQALAGVLVEAVPGSHTALTDAEGRFSLRLRAGDYLLHASRLGYAEGKRVVAVEGDSLGGLSFALAPQPLVLERVNVVLNRFESRRRTVPLASRVLDEQRLAHMGGFSVARVLESEAMMVPCAGSSRLFAGGSQGSCIYSRGQTVRPEVYVDDRLAFGGMDELDVYGTSEVHHVEIYGRGLMIRVYTRSYVERIIRSGRRLEPIFMRR